MKHTIIREQPVQPPIEKIILEVTPAELLTIARAVGRSSDVGERLYREIIHDVQPADLVEMYFYLQTALVEAGFAA